MAGHTPVSASVGHPFVIAETHAGALAQATPDLASFQALIRQIPDLNGRLALYLYARDRTGGVRARMFAPAEGLLEDPATGSAASALAALLLSHSDQEEADFDIVQGVEMGRPSRLRAKARRMSDGIHASVGGRCVPVLSGEALA